VIQLEKEVLESKKVNFSDRQLVQELVKSKEVLEKDLLKAQAVNRQQEEQTKKIEREISEKEKEAL